MPRQDVNFEGLRKLLATAELPELGPGPRPGVQPETVLRQAVADLLSQAETPDPRRELILALILLWHDHLEPAHVIAQSVEGCDGAFVHGIVHRREPDYGNAKYWFRRVGDHPAFAQIASQVALLSSGGPGKEAARRLAKGDQWDAAAFVDACEQAVGAAATSPLCQFLREAQKVETEVLLARLANR